MKDNIVFATTNARKVQDLKEIVKSKKLNFNILTMEDIGWDRGEIEEDGTTLEENSMIKARAVQEFCREKHILYPVMADDAGLFVRALNGEPGIRTARYADEERKANPDLPKFEIVNKLLRNLEGIEDRYAEYRCAITCIFPNNSVIVERGKTAGSIAKEMDKNIVKPYFYTVFVPEGKNKTMSQLSYEEIQDTYRLKALGNIFIKISKILEDEGR